MKRRTRLAALVFALLIPAAGAVTIDVPGDYPTIQQAIDAAQSGDEVLVAPGSTYADPIYEAGVGDTTLCCVKMKSGIKLRGSGIGRTIIDGDSLGRVIHLYQCSNVEISDLTVTGGFADYYGSGIFLRQSSAYIHNVEMTQNYDGAISMIENSAPTIEFCRMTENSAKYGGGLNVELDCTPSLYRCEILNNRAPFAGGVYLDDNAVLDHCVISGNRTTGSVNVFGGGILVKDSAVPTIAFCDITNNGCYGEGGGIAFVGEGTAGVVHDCYIAGNEAFGLEGHGGGVSITSSAWPTFYNCVVSGNWDSGEWTNGGGMWVQYANLDMYNCTFYANWSDHGDAGNIGVSVSMFTPGQVDIHHCIIADSPNGRGFYYEWFPEPAGVTLSCTDVYGNEGGDDIYEFTGAFGNFSLDPLLCDPAGGNFHVEDTSPCAPGNHPDGPTACGGLLIGAEREGCDSAVPDDPGAPVVRLLGNRPNPWTGSTVISFALPEAQQVVLDIIDPSGRQVALLRNGVLPAGIQQVTWDGRTLSGGQAPSGMYFYRLRCDGVTEGLRMLRLN